MPFLSEARASRRGEVSLTAEQLVSVAETIAAAHVAAQAPPQLAEWIARPQDLQSVAVVLAGARGSGYRILTPPCATATTRRTLSPTTRPRSTTT